MYTPATRLDEKGHGWQREAIVRQDSDGGNTAAIFSSFGISMRPSRLDADRRSSSAGHHRQREVAGATSDLYVIASCGVLVAGTLQPHVAAHGAEGLIVEG